MAHKKTKRRRPLKISIRGEGLEIEAQFDDDNLSEVIADAVRRVSGRPPATTTPREASLPSAELIREFGESLRKDQIEVLMNTLDVAQKVMFVEIMNSVRDPGASAGA